MGRGSLRSSRIMKAPVRQAAPLSRSTCSDWRCPIQSKLTSMHSVSAGLHRAGMPVGCFSASDVEHTLHRPWAEVIINVSQGVLSDAGCQQETSAEVEGFQDLACHAGPPDTCPWMADIAVEASRAGDTPQHRCWTGCGHLTVCCRSASSILDLAGRVSSSVHTTCSWGAQCLHLTEMGLQSQAPFDRIPLHDKRLQCSHAGV